MSERLRNEDGAALVVTLLVLLMMSALAMSLLAMSVTETRSTANSRDYEETLHVAESAADRVILEMVSDDDYTTGQLYAPVSQAAADERAWAIQQFNAALTNPAFANQFVQVGDITGLGIRALDTGAPMDVIFAVARHAAGDTRVLRLTIDQGMYIPQHALLTQGALTLQGAGGGNGIDGTAGNAHSNSPISANVTSVQVSGQVTSADVITPVGGSLTPTYVQNEPAVLVPPVSALRNYELRGAFESYNGATYTGTWFDLCAGGHVRPPAPAGGAPCSHTTSLNGGSGSYRGWSWSNPSQRWTLSTTTLWSGAYYVHEAEARVSGTPAGTSLTVLAQAPAAGGSQGSITMTGNARFTPHVQGLALLADRDIDINGTPSSDTGGLFLAGEQISVSGNGTITGALVAADRSAVSPVVTSNTFTGSASLTYNADMAVPLSGMVTIRRWNEL